MSAMLLKMKRNFGNVALYIERTTDANSFDGAGI